MLMIGWYLAIMQTTGGNTGESSTFSSYFTGNLSSSSIHCSYFLYAPCLSVYVWVFNMCILMFTGGMLCGQVCDRPLWMAQSSADPWLCCCIGLKDSCQTVIVMFSILLILIWGVRTKEPREVHCVHLSKIEFFFYSPFCTKRYCLYNSSTML